MVVYKFVSGRLGTSRAKNTPKGTPDRKVAGQSHGFVNALFYMSFRRNHFKMFSSSPAWLFFCLNFTLTNMEPQICFYLFSYRFFSSSSSFIALIAFYIFLSRILTISYPECFIPDEQDDDNHNHNDDDA